MLFAWSRVHFWFCKDNTKHTYILSPHCFLHLHYFLINTLPTHRIALVVHLFVGDKFCCIIKICIILKTFTKLSNKIKVNFGVKDPWNGEEKMMKLEKCGHLWRGEGSKTRKYEECAWPPPAPLSSFHTQIHFSLLLLPPMHPCWLQATAWSRKRCSLGKNIILTFKFCPGELWR